MRADRKTCRVHHLFFKNIIVTKKEDKDIEHRIKAAARRIPERL